MKTQKRIAVLLTISMILTLFPIISYADTTEPDQGNQTELLDVEGHWAEGAITKWVNLGVVSGDSRGFRPDDPITRAEMAVILDHLMGYQAKAQNEFTDINNGDWYADAVLKAKAAGILDGDGRGHAAPKANITREQAAVMLGRAFGADDGSIEKSAFHDANSVSSWAKAHVFGMEASHYIGGMGNGNFEPGANITRAQAITMIDNAVKGYYNVPGTYTDNIAPAISGANCVAIIKAEDVVLKGTQIDGDLIVAEGVGDGNVTLDNTKVTGEVYVRGGGKNSVHLINGAQVNGRVTIERIGGTVRIVSDGVTVAELDANTQVILEGDYEDVVVFDGAEVEVRGKVKNVTVSEKASLAVSKDADVNNIDVEEGAEGAEIKISGTVSSINASAPKTEIEVKSTAKVKKINVADTAGKTSVSMDNKAEIGSLNSESDISFSGDGKPDSITGKGKVTVKENNSGGGGGGGEVPGGQSDTVKPSLTSGTAVKVGETQASITFESSEAGAYYYKVAEHNGSKPTINTSGNGKTFTKLTTAITVSIDTVPKDIYIKVKDAAGNVSDSLCMVVPGRQLAPTGLEGIAPTSDSTHDGRITGVDTTMEYKQSLDSETEYQAIEGSSIEGLDPGMYDVRYQAQKYYFAGTAASVTVPKPQTEPEPEVLSIVGIMMGYAPADSFDNARIKVFTEFGTFTLYLTDDYSYDIDAQSGQLIICEINMNDEVEFIAQAQEEWTWEASRISKEGGDWKLSSGDEEYGIVADAAVFTYDGALPGEAGCGYNRSALEYLRYDRDISGPVSYFVTVEGDDVFALLLPESEVTVYAPQDVKGIAPTYADGTDGQITGVDDTMEYRSEGDEVYQQVGSGRIEGLTAGTYYVRYAAAGGYPASPDTEVVVPEFITIDQYGLVIAVRPASDFDNLRFKVLTVDGNRTTLTLEDDEVLNIKVGQLLAYGIGKDGSNWSIDDSDETVLSFASEDIIIDRADGMTLTDGNNTYEIADDVAVFTYSGSDPGAADYYKVSTIDLVKSSIKANATIADFPFIIYFNEEEKVVAILINEGFLVDEDGEEVYGVFNTRSITTAGGNSVYEFTGLIDGALFTKNTDDRDVEFNGNAGVFGVYKITVDANDVITGVAALDSAPVTSGTKASGIVAANKVISDINSSDRTVTTTGFEKYSIADNAVVYTFNVDSAEFALSEFSELREGYTLSLYDTKGADADGIASLVIYIENK